jgi:diguanylate cyclase (GGDEF)-like protein
MTVSFGVAELNAAGESVEQLLRRADAALYRAKAEGRNRVEVSEGVESTVREPKAT